MGNVAVDQVPVASVHDRLARVAEGTPEPVQAIIRTPSPPLGRTASPLVVSPTMLGSTVTPVAPPASSIPFLLLPENTFVLAVMWPPVEVTSRPSFPLGAAPLNASSPPKVLNVMNLLAVPATLMPFRVLSPDTLPSGITPPTTVFSEEPLTRTPLPLFPTADVLLAPTPKKLPWTVVLSELWTNRPFSLLPETIFRHFDRPVSGSGSGPTRGWNHSGDRAGP